MNGGQDDAAALRSDLADARRTIEEQALRIARLTEEATAYREETQHYVRNALSVLRSVARRTAGSSQTVEEFADRLDGRLAALARVQTALIRDPLGGADLEALVSDELIAFGAKIGSAIRVDGAPLRVRPKAASLLGLAFHELAVNSLEAGALGNSGTLAVRWRTDGPPDEAELSIEWIETGAHALRAPVAGSFAAQVLRDAIAYELAGSTLIDMTDDGLLCRLCLPQSWWFPR